MKKILSIFLFAALLFALPTIGHAQDWHATVPYQCGFEDHTENGAWVLLNGDSTVANKWYIDTAIAHCTEQSSSTSCGKSLYISDMEGYTYNYDNSIASRVIAYRDFALAQGTYVVSFDWNGVGEQDCDMLIAALVPANDTTPLFGSAQLPHGVSAWSLPEGWVSLSDNGRHTGLYNTTGWQRNEKVVEIGAPQDPTSGVTYYKLLFIWSNDYAEGSNPPAAVDNIAIRQVTCLAPTALSAIQDIFSITLNWQAGGNETQWLVSVDDTTVAWNETATSAPTMTVTGLQPNTTYTFIVRAVCGDGDTSFATSISATTGATIPYYENFNNSTLDFPAGWSYTLTGDSAYATSQYAPHIENNRLQMGGFGYLILPKINSRIDTLQLSFTHSTPYSHSASEPTPLVIGVMDNGIFTPIDTISDPQGGTFTKNVYFIGYQGTGRNIAFFNSSDNPDVHYATHYIDNIVVDYLPSCFPVADANATADSSSITVSWSPLFNSTTWQVTLTDADNSTEIDSVTSNTSIIFNDLAGNTEYQYAIRTVCGESDTSETIFGTIRTLCSSIPHAELPYSYGFEDEEGLGLCWKGYASSSLYIPSTSYGTAHSGSSFYSMNSSATEYSYVILPLFQDNPSSLMVSLWMRSTNRESTAKVVVGVMNDPTDISTFSAVDTITCSGTTMEFFEVPLTNYNGTGRNIALLCDSGAASRVCIDDVTVETTPLCSRVRSLEIPVVTAGAALLQWTTGRIGDYQGAEIQVRDTMSDTWTSYTSNNTEYLITNLSHNITYEVRVRAICENNETSLWVNSFFTTAMTNCNTIDSSSMATDTISGFSNSDHFEFPVHNWHNYSFSEQLFTSVEIDTAGTFNAIEFFYASDSLPMTAKDSCMIYMGVTSLNSLSSTDFVNPSNMTLVYSGPLNCSYGWNTFAFNHGFFNYDGRSNLVIAVVDNSGAAHNQSYRFACHSATGKAISFFSDDETFDNYPLMQHQEYPYRNNIVLHTAECGTESECYPPMIFIGSTGSDSVSFTLIPGGYETSWSIYHKAMGEENFTYQGATTQHSYTITDLEPSTTYTFRVIGDCEDSAYSDFTVTTKCLAQPLPYSEDFASWPVGASPIVPSCWYKYSSLGDNIPYIYPWSVAGHQSVLYLFSNAESYSYVAMPEMSAAIDSLQATFQIYREANTSNAVTGNHPLVVGVMTDANDITTFYPIDTIITTHIGMWEQIELPFDVLTTDSNLSTEQFNALRHGHIAFLSPDSIYSRPYIDDITIDYIPRCPHPAYVSVNQSLSTPDSVYLYWDNSANNVGIILTILSGDDTIAEYGNLNTSHLLVGGLNASMVYTAVVRGVCGEWSDNILLSTDTSTAVTTEFRTPCGTIKHSPWREGFEQNTAGNQFYAGFAKCWSRITDSCDYYAIPYVSNDVQNRDVHTGFRGLAWSASPNSLYGDYQYIVTPEIDTTVLPINQLELTFWARSYSSLQRPTFIVGVMDNNDTVGTSFSAVDTIIVEGFTSWHKYTVFFDRYNGDGTHIALKAERPGALWEAAIDDIEIRYAPLCPPVTDIVATAIDTNSLSISWIDHSNAISWEVLYGPHGFELGNGTYINCSTTSVAINGLANSTSYDVYVRPICGDDAAFTMATFSTADPYYAIPFYSNFSNYEDNAKWNLSNGQHVNAWVIGSALGNGDLNSLYISQDGGTTNSYNTDVTGISYAYVNLTFTDTGNYNYRFDWRSNGQSSYDYLRVALAPLSFVPQGGSSIPAGFSPNTLPVDWISLDGGSQLYGDTNGWTTVEREVHIATPGIYRLLFAWTDFYIAIGHQSPAAIDNVVVRRTSCQIPSNISIVPFNDSLYVSWTSNGDESQWIVTCNDNSMMAYDTHLMITGLTPNTDYNITIRAFCIEGDTSLAISRLCRTTCDPVVLPYSENFNSVTSATTAFTNVFPTCWMYQVTGTEGTRTPQIYYGSVNAHSGNYALFLGKIAYVSMPPMPVPLNQVELTFYHLVNNEDYAIQVGVMEGDNFIPIETFYDMEEVYAPHTVTFGSYTGQSRIIAFHNINEGLNGSPNFIDDITIEYLPPCMPVSNITAPIVSTNEIYLDWNSAATAQSWEIEYGPMGFEPGSGSTVTATTHPFAINGLDTLAAYDFYIRSYCGDTTYSDWTGPVQFNTSYCDDAAAFSNGPMGATSQYMPLSTSYSYSLTEFIIDANELGGLGDLSAIAFYYNDNDTMTVKNSVNIWLQPTTTTAFASDNSIIALDSNQATLVYSGNMNCHKGWNFFNFADPYVWNGVTNLMVIIDDNSGTYESTDLKFGIAQCSGQKTISYRSMMSDIDPTSPTGSYILKDRYNSRPLMQLISCGGASCHEPINLTAGTIGYENAVISWQGASRTYEIAIKKSTESEWGEPDTVHTTTTTGNYTINNLDEMTEYNFRVRQLCLSGVYSEWAESSFTTAMRPCLAPTSLYVTNVSYDRATIGWSSHNDQSVWHLRLSNNAHDTVLVVTEKPFTITGLAQDITYSVAVADSCTNNGSISDYSNVATFTTTVCQPVGNVAVSNVTANSAYVTWTGNSPSYTIEYGIGNFNIGSGTTISNINYCFANLTDLTPNEVYTVYVRANCSETAYSVWSERTEFHTTTSGIDQQIESSNPALEIFPNPAKDKTTINIVGINGEVELILVDMSGRIVKKTTALCGGDNCTATVELHDLAAGTYFVRASAPGTDIVRRLVVK